MTSNLMKNFAAAAVVGALFSFAVAGTTVSIAVVFHLTIGHSHQSGMKFLHKTRTKTLAPTNSQRLGQGEDNMRVLSF